MLNHRLPRLLHLLWRTSALLVTLCALPGCYLLQAASGQMELMSKRQPIDRLIDDPKTEESLRERLEYVRAARAFAVEALDLPDNGSYRSYVDLARPFVVWNVFATGRYSLEPREWCFPFAGCVVYRGYFDRDAAETYARRLRMAGEDAMVAGVAAYSTLGHFDDPVLSTMMRWSDAELAGTLFHELAHQIAYVPGDTRFNEAFATVVEQVGLTRWLEARGTPTEIERWRIARRRADDFRGLLLGARARLRRLYASGAPEAAMWRQKQRIFGALKYEYRQLRESWGGYSGYDAWFDRTLNNAHLVPIVTYHDCVPEFEQLLDAHEGDLAAFYTDVQRLAALPAERRAERPCGGGAVAAGLSAR